MTSVGSAARSTALSAGSPSVTEGALGCWQAERETAATTMGRVMLRPVHRPLAVATNNPPEDTFGGSTGMAHANGRGCSLEALRPRLSDGFAFVAFPRGGSDQCRVFFAAQRNFALWPFDTVLGSTTFRGTCCGRPAAG